MELRAATPSHVDLLDDRGRAWSASEAQDRVAKWASSDGSGDKDTIDWSKYGRAFMWQDTSTGHDGKDFGDYKLGFADVVDDKLVAVWKGVVAVAAVLQGSRGGVNVPDGDVAHLQQICEHYYNEARKMFKDDSIKAPWTRAFDPVDAFKREFGEFGGVERRVAKVTLVRDAEVDDSPNFRVGGHAIVFNQRSLDLGGFQEEIAPGALDDVLATSPDVHLVWDHNTLYVLSRTKNGTLDMAKDDVGIAFMGDVAPTSYASDLRILMEGGYVDQCSFAFTVEDDDWRIDDNGVIVRTVNKIAGLYDLTICAQGAYPQTDSESLRRYLLTEARARTSDDESLREFAEALSALGAEEESRALAPGTVAWDYEQGANDVMCDLECALEASDPDHAQYWYVYDINVRDGGTEAIACVWDYGTNESAYYLIPGIAYDADNEPVLPDPSMFVKVEQTWVAVQMGAAEEEDLADLASARYRRFLERRSNNGVNGPDGIDDANAGMEDTTDDVEGHRPTTNDEDPDDALGLEEEEETGGGAESDRTREDAEKRLRLLKLRARAVL